LKIRCFLRYIRGKESRGFVRKSGGKEEKSERIRANAQYQTYLLGTAEDNKRHWWQFWNKTNKERDN